MKLAVSRRLGNLAVLVALVCTPLAHAGPTLRIGYIGSLSGFAGAYGSAVLDGVTLAADELKAGGTAIELFIEDDESAPRQTASAYQKLSAINHVQAVVSGTWWANGIVAALKRDGIPLLSCETLYNKDYVHATNYFSLAGDLRDWIRAFAPLVERHGWRRIVMVKFISGFAATLEAELKTLFSGPERLFLRSIEYSDLEMRDSATIASKIKALKPEVVYIDSQPASFATLLSRLHAQKIAGLSILSHSVAQDAFAQKLFLPEFFSGQIFFTSRATFHPGFERKFREKFGRSPVLNADLGYYALHLLAKALQDNLGAVAALKSRAFGVNGTEFSFDENNVFRGQKLEIFTFEGGQPKRIL